MANNIVANLIFTLLIVYLVRTCHGSTDSTQKQYPLLMPDVRPLKAETLLCTAFKMRQHVSEYIVAFHPNASMHTAHHMLLYGCVLPGAVDRETPRLVWDCGEMTEGINSGFPRGSICGSGSQIIYAWAKDAPALELPKGVGFKVGQGTSINYLVLQVHYAHVAQFRNGGSDNSGVILSILPGDTSEVTKNAGVYLLGTGGSIPAKSTEYMETACTMDESVELHPFAFRTHTHTLGKVVSGYVIDQQGKWHLIGKHDPQEPQMFYPSEKNIVVKEGDVLAARCTMVNTRNKKTRIGATSDDEMCNFYMMYYIDGDTELRSKYCFSVGPPNYYWSWDSDRIDSVPADVDESASKLN